MAEQETTLPTVWVASGDPDSGRVAIWERAPEHPGGELFVAGADVAEAARTPEVERLLATGRLVEASAPATSAVPAQDDEDDEASDGESGEGGDHQPDPLVAAVGDAAAARLIEGGYDTVEAVAAASDEELLAIAGVGDATLAKIREAIPAQAV